MGVTLAGIIVAIVVTVTIASLGVAVNGLATALWDLIKET